MATESSSFEKSEPVAVVACDSEPVYPSVKAATKPKKSSKSKTKVKAVVAAVAATQDISEAEQLSNLTVDHPYLSVLYKRIRSHRKKLEKIKLLEQAQAKEGKVLNAQQLELMGNKATLEKLVAELEMLREQFVGVYSQEMEQKKLIEEKKEEKEEIVAVVEEIEQVQEKEEAEEVPEQQEQSQKEQQETHDEQEKGEEFNHVYELLKTLHVVNLHQALGKEVPMVLDFFSKVLLGNTRPPAELSYEENLMESLEEAKKYLTDSDKVFACDTTYSGLRAFVDELAKISSGKTEEEEVAEEEAVEEQVEKEAEEPAAAEETSGIPVVPAEINTMPQISFFTDSQLESEHGDEAGPEVIETHVETTEGVVVEVQNGVEEIIENHEVVIVEQVEAPADAPPVPELVPAPPLSFAEVAAGVSGERTPSPSASSGSSGQDKKEAGSGGNSPRNKNSRRRGQGRWREKGSNSNSGSKSDNMSPTNGGKPRRPRAPRTNDENKGNNVAQGGKRSGSKEGRRPRVERGLRKQGNASQQHTTPMIAPHA